MSTHTQSARRRASAVVGALALGIAGLAGASSAFADQGNIDPNATGSIVIHKHEAGSQKADGTADGQTDTQGGAGVAGVTFTAFPISNLDLKTQADWNNLKNWNIPADACGTDFNTPKLTLPSGAAAAFDAGKVSSPTNGQGLTTIGNLPVKAYLVCETKAPSTVKKKAAPFLVTIPFPNNAANTAHADGNWLYNVNVYPKNTVVVAPTKGVEVSKNGIKTADQVTFPVTAKIPSIAATDSFKHFVVSDPLDSNLEEGKVASVKIKGQAVDPSYYVATGGQNPSVGFTKAGLAYLRTVPNETIEVVFTAKVKTVPAGGVIENVANLYIDVIPGPTPPDNPPTTPPPSEPPTPTNKVVTSWGDITINKTDADNEKTLAGAKFKVYNATDPYAASCESAVKSGDPISIGGEDTFVSAANGVVSIEGLFVDKKQGAPDAQAVTPDHSQRCYVIEEIEAPAGYTLPSGGKEFTGITVKAGKTTSSAVTVKNSKQDVPGLPLTGAAGKLIMMLAGATLVAIAVGSVFVARSRRKRQTAAL